MKAIAPYSIAVKNYNINSMIRILAQVTHWEVTLLALPHMALRPLPWSCKRKSDKKTIENGFETKIKIKNIYSVIVLKHLLASLPKWHSDFADEI